MTLARYRSASFAAALALSLSVGCGDKDEETEPVPAPVLPAASAEVPVEPEPEPSASAPAASASAAKPKAAGSGDPTGMRQCCVSLRQNAGSAPDDQKEAYGRAADTCDAMVKSPQGRQALSQVANILKSAKLPPACQ
jgi:hypothetical protein